ncbi:hypothetical protein EJ03DRAFT_342900 [Teratosphaeria nubilosa]|uniref:SPRY domain-containing protein n=1 Tax=Teratosphaeria nubilosa TaxID=161662 RepID=A0A6G1LBA4_9PEZI|nr:hypothetical protein EJ03DRAFT_342900 [Teratosphaeria nubilosa]
MSEQFPPPSALSPRPPPSHVEPDPPPYDPWLAVPDNALLPPPPALREERSPVANASYDDAARGHAWCRANPIWKPQRHNEETLARSQAGHIHLTSPPRSQHVTVGLRRQGRTHVKTTKPCADTILLSDVPLLIPSAFTSVPNQQARTIYFELHVIHMGASGEGDAGIAIGFLAPPYPSWRLPGWHRASLGVHGDDGRRYVDDSWGGRDFVDPFIPGDVVGLGMKFGSKIEVFFTRNGRSEAGWDLHEERDSQTEEGDVFGLEGKHDLLAAIGVFGDVEFEVCFEREGWMFRL